VEQRTPQQAADHLGFVVKGNVAGKLRRYTITTLIPDYPGVSLHRNLPALSSPTPLGCPSFRRTLDRGPGQGAGIQHASSFRRRLESSQIMVVCKSCQSSGCPRIKYRAGPVKYKTEQDFTGQALLNTKQNKISQGRH